MALATLLTFTPNGDIVPVQAPPLPQNIRDNARMWHELMKLIPALPPAYFREKDTWSGSGEFNGVKDGVAQIAIRSGAQSSRYTVNHEAGHALQSVLDPSVLGSYWQVRGLPGTPDTWPRGNMPWQMQEEMFADDLGALAEPDGYEAYAQRATGVPYQRSVMDAFYRGIK